VIPPSAQEPGPTGRTFGTVADLYDRHRPDYPPALIEAVLALVPGPARVLEAGAGTGIATEQLARAGAAVVAVEPDPAMAARARVRCAGLAVEVVEAPFEAVGPPAVPGPFDLVAAAQAWHWIEAERGRAVARALLRPGGALACWWHTPRDGPDYEALVGLYRALAPDMVPGMAVASWEAEMDRMRRALVGPGFAPPETSLVDWTARLGPDRVAGLLRTYAGHHQLDPALLDQLTDGAAALARRRGGVLALGYRTVLHCARRVPG
jgi:SAM-dependent methyltransferase